MSASSSLTIHLDAALDRLIHIYSMWQLTLEQRDEIDRVLADLWAFIRDMGKVSAGMPARVQRPGGDEAEGQEEESEITDEYETTGSSEDEAPDDARPPRRVIDALMLLETRPR